VILRGCLIRRSFFISINSELFFNILWKMVVAGTPVAACDTPFSFDSPNYSRNSFLAFSQKMAEFSESQFLRKFPIGSILAK